MKQESVFGSDLGLRAGEWPLIIRVEHDMTLVDEEFRGKMFMKVGPKYGREELESVLYSWNDLELEVWND